MAKLVVPAAIGGPSTAPKGWPIVGLAIAAWLVVVALIYAARALFGFVLAAF